MAGGKGLLALHSASFCFQNSPPYIALLGAQFERHGTGEFTAAFVNPSHPVLAGLQPFQVWDETYVHTKLGPDRTVLMERTEGAAASRGRGSAPTEKAAFSTRPMGTTSECGAIRASTRS